MALSTTEKAQARLYLGYSGLFRYLHTRLEGALTSLDADGETLVRTQLTSLASLDTALGTAVTSSAGVKKADEVEFFGSSTATGGMTRIEELRRQGRLLVGRLSTMLGVPVYADYFGDDGYPGDTYSDLGLPGGRRGSGTIPLG